MNNLISTTVIRQRGQLTIPKKFRNKASWLSEGSVVALLTSIQKEIKIIPYQEVSLRVDWKNIWEKIKLARTFVGKRGNLSQFITKDRFSH